jgi:hypothetical protein
MTPTKLYSGRLAPAAWSGYTPVMDPAAARSAGVYILKFSTGRLYVGASLNLAKRLEQHRLNLARGSHSLPHLQAEFDAAVGVYTVDQRELPVHDGYELQVIEAVMIRRMIQRYGQARVINRQEQPVPIVLRPTGRAEPLELHPYE